MKFWKKKKKKKIKQFFQKLSLFKQKTLWLRVKEFFASKPILKKKKYLISAFILILVVGFVFFLFSSKKVEAEWWDTNWHYRQLLELSNSGDAVTNQYVKFVLDTASLISAGKMETDCRDIRITGLNGKNLTYFIDGDPEYDCNDTDTSIYILVDEIPVNEKNLYLYYGNPSSPNIKPILGSSKNPGISCRNINEHQEVGDKTTFYITPSGNLTDKIQVDCDMTTDGGGWIKIYEGLCTSATSVSRTLGNVVELSNNIPFNEMMVNAKNWDLSETQTTTETAKMEQTFSWYFEWVHDQPDSPNPDVKFHDLDGNQDVQFTVLGQLLRGYGNSWRHLVTGEYNTQDHDSYMYLGGVPSSIHTDDWGYGNYNSHINDTSPRESGLNLTPREFQEIYVWVRENDIVLDIDQSITLTGDEEVGSGPVGHWSFDEGYGSSALDKTSNNNDGTITGATWQTEDMCISGKCLWFGGGVSDRINCGNSSNLLMENITISTWVRPNSYDIHYPIFVRKGDNYRTGLREPGDGRVYFRLIIAGTTRSLGSVEEVPVNKWTHVVATYDGEYMKIYIDGKLDSTSVYLPGGIDSSSDPLILGAYDTSGSYSFDGFIDEVKIYPYARTAEQIKADYNIGKSGLTSLKGSAIGFGTPTSTGGEGFLSDGLVGYWKMDESSGNAIDSSGNGNTGTWYGTGSHYAAGKFANGGGFNGSSDYVEIDNVASNIVGNSVTFSAWINGPEQHHKGIVPVNTSSGGNRALFLVYENKIGLYDSSWDVGTKVVVDDTWHHVVYTYNSDNGIAILYVDGEADGEFNKSINYTSDDLVSIGQEWDSGNTSDHFNGLIDEVRIYNRALSAREVRQLYEWAPEPIVYYNFEEGSGTNLYDKSGNENNSTSFVGSPTWVQGKYGGALEFDGENDYINIGSPMNDVKEFNISTWIKTTQQETNSTPYRIPAIVGVQHASGFVTNDFVLINDNGNLGWWDEFNGEYKLEYDSGYFISNGEWHYIAANRSIEGSNSIIDLYVDGIKVGSTTSAGTGAIERPIRIAYSYDNYTYIDGQLDDVRIYNYARTQKQILEDMNAGRPAQKSPVGYWKFNEGYGISAKDSSGYGNDGTLVNSPNWVNNGKFSKALDFDGIDNAYVEHPEIVFDITEPWSFSMWQKIPSDNDGSWEGFIGGSLGLNGGYWFYHSGGKFSWYQDYYNSTGYIWYSNLNLGDEIPYEEWTHLTVVNKPIDNNETKVKIYVNAGESIDSTTMNWSPRPVEQFTFKWIGIGDGNRYFNGLIDEVKVYNYALTKDEIKAEYNQGKVGMMGAPSSDTTSGGHSSALEYCVPGSSDSCSPPVAEWNFNKSNANIGSSSNNPGYSCYEIKIFNSDAPDGVYWIDPNGGDTSDSFQVYCDMTTDGGGWTMIWKNFGGPRYSDYSGQLSNSDLWATTNSNITAPFSYNSQIASHKNVEAWNSFIDSTNVEWIKIGNGYDSNEDLYSFNYDHDSAPNGSYFEHPYEIKLDLGENVAMSDIMTTTDCTQLNNDVEMFVNDVSYGSSNCTASSSTSMGFANSDDACGGCNLMEGWGARHVLSYNHTATGRDTIRCQFECWGSTDVVFEAVWGVRELSPRMHAYDTSGNGNTGILTNMSDESWVTGKNGRSLEFDGDDDYVKPVSSGFYPSCDTGCENPYTISAWIKTNNFTQDSAIAGRLDSGGSHWEGWGSGLKYINGSIAVMGRYNGDNDLLTYDISDSEWHHVVGITNTSNGKLYVDGVLVDSGVLNSGYSYSFCIGAQCNDGNSHNFDGIIDNVRVYDYARTPAQVAWEYSKGKPIAHYKMDKGEGTIIYDSSGNGNNGTLNLGSSGQTSAGSVKVADNTAWYNGRQGKQNYSLNFDGVDDVVTPGTVIDSNLSEYTVTLWAKGVNFPSSNHKMLISDVGGHWWYISVNSGKWFYRSDNGSDNWGLEDPIENQWYFIAIKHTGNNKYLYIDGIEQSVVNGTTIDDSSLSVEIGKYSDSYPLWEGQIDDVKIWNYALTEDQIKTEYNLGAAKVGSFGEKWGESELWAGRSCYTIKQSRPNAPDGTYWINPDGSEAFQVYCDMTTDGGGWTLIRSFSKDNRAPYKNAAFLDDTPRNQDNPSNFSDYSLSKTRMDKLKGVASYWRATCNMNSDPTRDFARGKLSDHDIMTYSGSGTCSPLDAINIRGYSCTDCNVRWWQTTGGYHMHTDSGHNQCGTCSSPCLDPSSGSTSSEDNWGYYSGDTQCNPDFQCCSLGASTTNWWMK